MTGKNPSDGRFVSGNSFSSAGGQARAAKLTPERRREIARAGWLAMIERRFGGNVQAAGRAIARAANPPDAIFYGHNGHSEVIP